MEDQEVYNPFDIQSERQFPKKQEQKQQQSWKSKNIYVQIAPPSSHTMHSWLLPLLLGFLHSALFQLQNINHCCVISSHFSTFKELPSPLSPVLHLPPNLSDPHPPLLPSQ